MGVERGAATGSAAVLKVARQPRTAAYFRVARIRQCERAPSLVVLLNTHGEAAAGLRNPCASKTHLGGLATACVCRVVAAPGSGRVAGSLVSSALAIGAKEACDGLGAVG